MHQDTSVFALTSMQTLGLYVGLPALLFGAIALLAYLTSRPSGGPDGAFPRLAPGQALVHNNGVHAGPQRPEPPVEPAAAQPDQPPPQDAAQDACSVIVPVDDDQKTRLPSDTAPSTTQITGEAAAAELPDPFLAEQPLRALGTGDQDAPSPSEPSPVDQAGGADGSRAAAQRPGQAAADPFGNGQCGAENRRPAAGEEGASPSRNG